MAQITYQWANNSKIKTQYLFRDCPSRTWGNGTVEERYVNLTTNDDYSAIYGTEYLTVTGDTDKLPAARITHISFSTCWVNSNGSGMRANLKIYGNGGDFVYTYSTAAADSLPWLSGSTGENIYSVEQDVNLNGILLKNFLGPAVYGSAYSSYLRLPVNGLKPTILTITFDPSIPAKYYTNQNWNDCNINYRVEDEWKKVVPYRWNGTIWERV